MIMFDSFHEHVNSEKNMPLRNSALDWFHKHVNSEIGGGDYEQGVFFLFHKYVSRKDKKWC